MMKVVLLVLLLNVGMVSAWWSTFHEEQVAWDKTNTKDTCIASYDTMMKESKFSN